MAISDKNPPLNVEEGEDGFVPITDDEEEVIYVDSEQDIPVDTPPAEPKPEPPSISEILEKQGQQQAQAIRDLGSLLGQNRHQAATPQQPQMSDEEFNKKYNDMLFKDPAAAAQMREQRVLGPVLGMLNQQNFELKKELLATKDDTKELFKTYKGEIEEEISNLPPHMRNNPAALDTVMQNVKFRHIDDIAKKYAEDLLEEKLKELQNAGQLSRGAASQPTHISAGGVQVGGSAKKNPVYKLKATPKEIEFARVKGMSIDDVQEYFKENGISRT